jgi:hypothetical protein
VKGYGGSNALSSAWGRKAREGAYGTQAIDVAAALAVGALVGALGNAEPERGGRVDQLLE